MPLTDPMAAQRGGDLLPGHELGSRRAAAARRRRMRLRRSLAGLATLMLLATVVARWPHDPGDDLGTGIPVPVAIMPVADPEADTATPHADDEAEADLSPTAVTAESRPAVPAAGAGTVTAVAIPQGSEKQSAQQKTGRVVRYSIEVEDGLTVDTREVAVTVAAVLSDDRGWQEVDGVRFVAVAPTDVSGGAPVDIRVTLASPALTARLCAPLNVSAQQVSCWNGGRSVLNLTRWVLGSRTYGADLAAYRTYLVNHEVGHGLGHQHRGCPGPGKPAPVMVQQTKSLEGCTPWPYPDPS